MYEIFGDLLHEKAPKLSSKKKSLNSAKYDQIWGLNGILLPY